MPRARLLGSSRHVVGVKAGSCCEPGLKSVTIRILHLRPGPFVNGKKTCGIAAYRLSGRVTVIITFDQSLARQFRPSPIPMSRINVTTPINASASRLSEVTGFVFPRY
ncbi:unnamed protein product [Leuciscus chuanchicus]